MSLPTVAEQLLKELVQALDNAFISSWQTTAGWKSELDNARHFLSVQKEEEKSFRK